MPVMKQSANLTVLNIGLNKRYNVVKQTERMMTMFTFRNVMGHVQVYDYKGQFLFSADNEQEAREELEEYAESAA